MMGLLFITILSLFLVLFVVIYYIIITHSFCNIATLVSAFFAIDVILPMICYSYTEKKEIPWYFPPLTRYDYLNAYVLLVCGYVLFIISYRIFIVPKKMQYKTNDNRLYERINNKLMQFWWGLIFFYFLGICIDVFSVGNIHDYYTYSITRSVSAYIVYPNAIVRYIRLLCSFTLSPILIISALNLNCSRKQFKKMCCLIVTLCIAITTLSRGTLIEFFVMIAVVLEAKEASIAKVGKKLIIWIIAGGIMFVVFTGVRGVMTSARWGVDDYSGKNFLFYTMQQLFLSIGSSLISVARICHHISDSGDVFWGISFWEILYRFIPRAFWTTKPIQYGIQTINEMLGTPESTMDAITPVGELVANFGYFGVLLIPVYGVIAAKIENVRRNKINLLVYSGFVFSTVTTTMWMGSTGFMSNVIMIAFTWGVFGLLMRLPVIHFSLGKKISVVPK